MQPRVQCSGDVILDNGSLHILNDQRYVRPGHIRGLHSTEMLINPGQYHFRRISISFKSDEKSFRVLLKCVSIYVVDGDSAGKSITITLAIQLRLGPERDGGRVSRYVVAITTRPASVTTNSRTQFTNNPIIASFVRGGALVGHFVMITCYHGPFEESHQNNVLVTVHCSRGHK